MSLRWRRSLPPRTLARLLRQDDYAHRGSNCDRLDDRPLLASRAVLADGGRRRAARGRDGAGGRRRFAPTRSSSRSWNACERSLTSLPVSRSHERLPVAARLGRAYDPARAWLTLTRRQIPAALPTHARTLASAALPAY